ncbi:TolB family protein [Zavarzinella formosa]|uniref:TolB family protein n=1 Tax=Zavarzinella formosa TaxID=360055 RepID=UPI0002DB3F67|nr:TolB family protein [Zavarzinella formosa]
MNFSKLALIGLLLTSSLTAAEPIRLTTDGGTKSDLAFTAKGDEIVFTSLDLPTLLTLKRLKLADKTIDRLHPSATTSEYESTHTPDDGMYAFIQSRGNLNMRLVIRETKTGKENVFDPSGGFSSIRRPTFHPSGERVAFAIPAATGQEIASVNKEGKDRKQVASGGINSWPTYSPDGKKIAFCSSRDGDFDLYVANADGSNPKRVIKLAGMQSHPAWSPDSQRIAFASNHGDNYDLYVVNVDGTHLKQLTNHPERDDYPAWHPDGKRIVFVGERKGKLDLYLMVVD